MAQGQLDGSDALELNGGYSGRVARNVLYSDIDTAFQPNPITEDAPKLVDVVAVKRALRNLVLTEFFERPFAPNLGTGVSGLLFENADAFTRLALKEAITKAVVRYEPRVDLKKVTVVDSSDRNAYEITLNFRVISLKELVEYTLYLKRTR